MSLSAKFIASISEISSAEWNNLVRNRYPFARHEFLSALEKSNSVGSDAGWIPRHLVLEDEQGVAAALPLYEKHHSYGEYVFDWQWAGAFEQHGRAYYPKLLSAIPYSPVTGPRILTREDIRIADALANMWPAIQLLAEKMSMSSWHLLFADQQTDHLLCQQDALMKREDVQFHWFNRSAKTEQPYQNFDQFLQDFRSSKRKQIKRERRKVAEQGIELKRVAADQLSTSDWADFYSCYQATYLKRSGHSGYLNTAFFDHLAENLSDQCMLVKAYQDETLIAGSLFLFDDQRLYGRYWGALSNYDCLHFEACYYQGIEFAIEKGLACFDPGTQGEHKLVRGFEPTKTQSFHWIADQQFAAAIDRFLTQERQHTDRYQQSAAEHLPFHRDANSSA